MRTNLKVTFLSYDFPEYCIRLASALSRDATVQLLLPEDGVQPHLRRLDPAVEFQPFRKPRYRQPILQVRTTLDLVGRIRRFDPDVIHLQQGHMWFNFALPLLGRYPLVVTVHDPRHHVGDLNSRKVPQWILDMGFRRADQVIVHSPQLVREVVDEVGIPADAVSVIPHIALGDESSGGQVQEEEHLVLFFGRIWEYKGLDYLIRAEPMISEQVPNVRIAIAGDGEDFSRYRRMMVHPDRFEVHNEFVPDDRVAEFFGRASVVVLPYVDASQSGVIPVAYTFGKPVVATTVGGLPNMVEHGRTGYLVPPRDETALARAVVDLLRDGKLRREMGANGKRKLDAECGPEVVARETLAVYSRAARPGGRKAGGKAA